MNLIGKVLSALMVIISAFSAIFGSIETATWMVACAIYMLIAFSEE